MDEKTIRTVLSGYKIHNCEVMIREDVSPQCTRQLPVTLMQGFTRSM